MACILVPTNSTLLLSFYKNPQGNTFYSDLLKTMRRFFYYYCMKKIFSIKIWQNRKLKRNSKHEYNLSSRLSKFWSMLIGDWARERRGRTGGRNLLWGVVYGSWRGPPYESNRLCFDRFQRIEPIVSRKLMQNDNNWTKFCTFSNIETYNSSIVEFDNLLNKKRSFAVHAI